MGMVKYSKKEAYQRLNSKTIDEIDKCDLTKVSLKQIKKKKKK